MTNQNTAVLIAFGLLIRPAVQIAKALTWVSCTEVSQLCRAWRCVYWKVFKVSTDEAIDFIKTDTGLHALDSEISCRKFFYS